MTETSGSLPAAIAQGTAVIESLCTSAEAGWQISTWRGYSSRDWRNLVDSPEQLDFITQTLGGEERKALFKKGESGKIFLLLSSLPPRVRVLATLTDGSLNNIKECMRLP